MLQLVTVYRLLGVRSFPIRAQWVLRKGKRGERERQRGGGGGVEKKMKRNKHDLITVGVFVYGLKMTWLKLIQQQRVRNGK